MADNQSVGQISLDITGNEKPLQKKIEGLGSKLKAPMEKLGTAMAAAFSTALIAKFAKESIESAAQVNAANSQMAQTFGKLEDKARSVMSSVAKSSGIMETRLQGVGTSIYAFAKTSGMDSASAMSMMKDALQATADSAAYYDRSLEDTAESLKSFLKGNYANDAALGISCTETTRNAVANKLYGKSFKDLSEAQKQLALLQMVKDANKLSGAMGQAAREADGWENVTGNLKESWKQFQAVIGQPILKIATAVVKNLTSALQTLTVYVKSAFQSLSGLLKLDMSGISSAGTAAAESISAVAVNADSSTDNLNAATKAAEKLKKTVAGFDQLNILSSSGEKDDTGTQADAGTGSFSLPAADIGKAESAADGFGKKLDGLKNKLKKLFDSSGLSKAVSSFKKQFDKIDLKQIGKNFHSIFADLKPIAKAGLDGAAKISKSRLAYIGTLFGGVTRTAGNAIQTASGGIAKWLDKDKTRIAGFVSSITDKISSGIDNCTAYAGTMFDTFNGSLERMRSDTENAISGLLSGFSGFAGSVGEVIAGGFEKITKVASEWAEDNSDILGEAFDSTQDTFNQVIKGVGKAFDDIGRQLSTWWNDSGAATTFENICKIFADLGTAAVRLYNKAIKPAVDNMLKKFGSMWNSMSPIFGNVLNFFRAVGDMVVYLWNNQLKPIIDLVVDYIGPVIMGVVDVIIGVLQGLWKSICSIVNGIIEMFTGVIDFFTGVFTGDWEKAWDGIKTFFIGIWDAISGAVQGVVDEIVSVFTGLVEIVSGILQLLWARIVQVLEQIWGVFSSVFSAIGEFFKKLWNDIVNLFKGIGKWFGDRFKEAWTGVTNAWNGAVNFFKNVWNGIKNAFSTAKNWLVEQFTAAWNGIQSLFNKGGEIFNGIKDAMGDIFKQAVNGLIDGINWVIAQPINGLNGVLSSLKGVDIAGIKPFDWINTIPVPEIPHLAKGGLVSAPTLAMVGDNRGAAHDPEVVSPLSKLKSMIGGSDPEIIRLLQKIITLLENEESVYQNNFYVDSERIESRLVRIRRRKQRRYGGAV